MRLLKKALVVSATAGLLGAAGISAATVASADPAPCPPSFFLSPPAPGDEHFDHNGNGLVCVHPTGDGGGNSAVPGFTIKDDNLGPGKG